MLVRTWSDNNKCRSVLLSSARPTWLDLQEALTPNPSSSLRLRETLLLVTEENWLAVTEAARVRVSSLQELPTVSLVWRPAVDEGTATVRGDGDGDGSGGGGSGNERGSDITSTVLESLHMARWVMGLGGHDGSSLTTAQGGGDRHHNEDDDLSGGAIAERTELSTEEAVRQFAELFQTPAFIAFITSARRPREVEGGDGRRCRHEDVVCGGCGSVVEGTRFKCVSCANFDLCEACEGFVMSLHTPTHSYLRLPHPVPPHLLAPAAAALRPVFSGGTAAVDSSSAVSEGSRRPMGPGGGMAASHLRPSITSSDGLHPSRVRETAPQPAVYTQSLRGGTSGGAPLSARFVEHVTVPEGSILTVGTPFVKIWAIRNDGQQSWPAGVTLRLVGGPSLGGRSPQPVVSCHSRHTLHVAVDMEAPRSPGRYAASWRLHTSDGTPFGHRVLVEIEAVV